MKKGENHLQFTPTINALCRLVAKTQRREQRAEMLFGQSRVAYYGLFFCACRLRNDLEKTFQLMILYASDRQTRQLLACHFDRVDFVAFFQISRVHPLKKRQCHY